MRLAQLSDLPVLLQLQRAFYAEERIAPHARTEAAFGELLGTPHLGGCVVLEEAGVLFGYVVWAYGFSLEAGGRDAFIDELFVSPAARGRGHGKALLQLALEQAADAGALAVHLEMAEPTPEKLKLYVSHGFKQRPHPLLSKR